MDEIAKKMAELAEKYGPSVIDATRGAVQIEAYSTLAGSVVSSAFAFTFLFAGRWLYCKNTKDDLDDSICKVFGFILMGIAAIPAAFAIWAWIDPWTWVAIANPDLWIAKKVFKL